MAFVQVIALEERIEEIIGVIVSVITVTFCVEVHPFVGFVAVTV